MKRILILLCLAFPLLLVFLPEVTMGLTDRQNRGSAESISVAEVRLLMERTPWDLYFTVPEKLTAFSQGERNAVYLGADDEKCAAAMENARAVLNAVTGTDQEQSFLSGWAEYELACFSDVMAFPVWHVWLEYDSEAKVSVVLDDTTGAVLSMVIVGEQEGVAALFEQSYLRYAEGGGMLPFEDYIMQTAAAALSEHMGREPVMSATLDTDGQTLTLSMEEGSAEVPFFCKIGDAPSYVAFNSKDRALLNLAEDAAVEIE